MIAAPRIFDPTFLRAIAVWTVDRAHGYSNSGGFRENLTLRLAITHGEIALVGSRPVRDTLCVENWSRKPGRWRTPLPTCFPMRALIECGEMYRSHPPRIWLSRVSVLDEDRSRQIARFIVPACRCSLHRHAHVCRSQSHRGRGSFIGRMEAVSEKKRIRASCSSSWSDSSRGRL